MQKSEEKQQKLVAKIAQYILENGLNAATLINLADYCDTSDRMLMYYFRTKQNLLKLALDVLSRDMILLLDSFDAKPMDLEEYIAFISVVLKSESARPYNVLWLEIIAKSARSKEQELKVLAIHLINNFTKWIENIFVTGNREIQKINLARALVITEGLIVLNSLDLDAQLDFQ